MRYCRSAARVRCVPVLPVEFPFAHGRLPASWAGQPGASWHHPPLGLATVRKDAAGSVEGDDRWARNS